MKKKLVEKAVRNNNEFWAFLKNYNVIELAIGIVIGGAVKDLVSSIANDLLPIVGMVTPDGSWKNIVITIANSEFKIGNLMSNTLNFVIVAIIVFVVVKKIMKIENNK